MEQIINKNYMASLSGTEVREVIILGLAFAKKKVKYKYEIRDL
jgi:hypothetical protein